MTELCDQSAVDLQKLLRSGEICSAELVENCIARINDRNPRVNAVVTTNFEAARLEAADADKALKQGASLGPLHGIPFLAKDLADTKGLRTTYGSLVYTDHVPDADAIVVSRLRKAGAICLGKTNTPEFGAGANTTNAVFGATANPFDVSRTCGGSSGGSAVALACGMAPLATGSDLGGSLRIPASFCGVVGMRPSSGLVPSRAHVMGFSPLWTDGPMARNVPDTALMLSVIAGQHKDDPMSFPIQAPGKLAELTPVDLSEMRVGVSQDLGFADIDPPIAEVFGNCVEQIARIVGTVTRPDVDLKAARPAFRALRAESVHASFATLAAEHGSRLGPNVLANLSEAEQIRLPELAAANSTQTLLFRQFQALFDTIDVLICPATALSPFPLEMNAPVEIDSKPLATFYDWYAITWALSLLGCPVVTLPCGRDHNGLPFGIQIVTRRHEDAKALAIAAAFENAPGFGAKTMC